MTPPIEKSSKGRTTCKSEKNKNTRRKRVPLRKIDPCIWYRLVGNAQPPTYVRWHPTSISRVLPQERGDGSLVQERRGKSNYFRVHPVKPYEGG